MLSLVGCAVDLWSKVWCSLVKQRYIQSETSEVESSAMKRSLAGSSVVKAKIHHNKAKLSPDESA